MKWYSEDIPDTAQVFLRFNKIFYRNKNLQLGAFREHGEGEKKGMSTDWDKYSSPEQTRARSKSSAPEVNGVAQLNVGKVRSIPLQVLHSPIQDEPDQDDNIAHTDIKGIGIGVEKTKNRLKLQDISFPLIEPDVS